MKGFLQGSLWGLIVGVTGLAVASLATEQAEFATGPDEPQMVAPELAVVDTGSAVALEVTEETAPANVVVTPLDVLADPAEAAPEISTAPVEAPPVAEVSPSVDAPTPAPQVAVASGTEEPVTRSVQSDLAKTDTGNSEPVVDASPAPAVAEAVETVESEPVQPATAPLSETDDVATVDEPAGEPAIVADTAPLAEDKPAAPATEETAADGIPPVPDEGPQAQTSEAVPSTEAVIVAQALPQASGAVRINRPGATPVETESETTAAPEADALPVDAPALLRFAAPFENAEGLPVIAVLLVDTGEMDPALASSDNLGFTPTVAINALGADAGSKLAAYQAAGAEVAMQLDLPDGARPSDVEVAFEAAFELLPDAAMLFSNGSGAIEERSVVAQVMEILAADGHGFVTIQRGFGSAARTAEQAGVPAATVLRDLDGAGEDKRAITRALDQAAFRARQTGEIVLLGRMRPETVDALRDWAADLGRETLAIAPVTAILLQQE